MRSFAALASCVVACSPVKGVLLDASGPNEGLGIDAPAHGVVTVTVLDPQGTGAPTQGVPVVFVDPSGMVVAHPVTDANGKASQDVKAGSSVTVVEMTSTNGFEMIAILDVAPGDNLL